MIPFLDLNALNAPHQLALQQAAGRVLTSGWYVLGREVETFERAWASYCNTRHCIGVASGLDALTLTLRAWELPERSEVIVAANAYVASVLAVLHAGLVPVLVEPDAQTGLLDAQRVEAALTERTRVLLPVHLYGRCCDMAALRSLAQKHNLLILEDAAQAHGATYQGQKAGALGDAAGWSFYPTKNLGALGDAGAITTDDDALAERLRAWRNYGSARRYENQYVGYNSRLDELQAALLSAKLPALDAENAQRRAQALRYLSELNVAGLHLPPADQPNADVWHLFVVRHAQRDRLRDHLREHGIGTDVHYPTPPFRQTALTTLFADHRYAGADWPGHDWPGHDWPVAEQWSREALSLPLNPALSDEQLSRIIAAVNAFTT